MDVSTTTGYGGWGSDGNGECASWRGFLASILDDHAAGYYQNWHQLFDKSFLEREVYAMVARRMLALAERCPEERALVHNDFHFNNILTDGARITAAPAYSRGTRPYALSETRGRTGRVSAVRG